MATPTPANIKTRYPALVGIPDGAIQLAINDAVPMFDEARWGGWFDQGFAAYVAHMVLADQNLNAGQSAQQVGVLLSKKVGDVQVNYAQPSGITARDAFFAGTTYGQRYLQLRRLVGSGGMAL